MTTARDVKDRLRTVQNPAVDGDIVETGVVSDVRVDDDTAVVSLAFNTPYAPAEMELGDEIREAVAETGLEPDLRARATGDHGFDEEVLPNVRNVIAVASGKGGVGKTTVAANLAAGLSEKGARVGILDADVHGPNVPRVLPVEGEPGVTPNDEIVPPRSGEVMVMSMRFLTHNDDDPAIMRGPMVNNVMMKFVNDVEWGRLDYLVVDLPPGTGDASLNLLQTMPVTGAVVVTTPQQMSVDDTRKGIRMFEKHDTPILGLVENMSGYHCPGCEEQHELFGTDGASEIVDDYDVTLLDSLPVHPDFGTEQETGPVARDDDSPMQRQVLDLVDAVADRISHVNMGIVADNTEPEPADGEEIPTSEEPANP